VRSPEPHSFARSSKVGDVHELTVEKKVHQEVPDKCKYYRVEKHPKRGKLGLFLGRRRPVDLPREKSFQLLRFGTPIHVIQIVHWLFKLYPLSVAAPDPRLRLQFFHSPRSPISFCRFVWHLSAPRPYVLPSLFRAP